MKSNFLPANAIALFILCLAATTSLAAEEAGDSLEKVKANLGQKKAVLIDVREKDEWDKGHLKGAIFVPLSRLQAGVDPKSLAKQLDKETICYTHCRAGRRAVAAAEILEELGYEVRPLKQGYEDLLKAGFPKAKTKKESE